MSYYSSRRTGTSPPPYIWWLSGIGALLIICGVGLNVVDNVRKTSAEKAIVAVEERRVEALVSLVQAEKEDAENAGNFANHWSADFPSQLQQARQNLIDNGQVALLLGQAKLELKAKHYNEAKSFADQADKIVTASLDVVNKILGPPAFFDELQRRSGEVDKGILETVRAEIARQRAFVNSAERKQLCGSVRRLSFASAYTYLTNAEAQLVEANRLNTVLVDGLIDKPAVYDMAAAAMNTAASSAAETNKSLADLETAERAIVNAQLTIDSSNAYILTSFYETLAATTALDGARSTLTLAKQACYSEDFTGSVSLANQSQSQAVTAQNIATPPTPVPVVVIIHSDSGGGSDSGGSNDSGSSSSGSWDSGGSSDSGGWDSGGSSSDSGGWDSGGGSDGGGFDSGGGDDGGGW